MAQIRQNGLINLAAAYNCSNVRIDAGLIQKWLLFPSKDCLFECLKQFFTNVSFNFFF